MNLFALRATDPKVLMRHMEPIGPENDEYLRASAKLSKTTVVAWGRHGSHMKRSAAVLELLQDDGIKLKHLGVTFDYEPRHYEPRHPLYLAGQTTLKDWEDIR
jgi:hypothetical protein